jgi:hypothetical protein
MLAARRRFKLKDGSIARTPLLLPSFSSKTFQDERVSEIIECTAQMITDEMLISAYDLYYGEIKKKSRSPL